MRYRKGMNASYRLLLLLLACCVSFSFPHSAQAAVDVSSISISKESLSLHVGQTTSLTAAISPSNATNQTVSWGSSNTLIATVDSAGVITALSPGVAVISAASQDGNYVETCVVTVFKYRESYTNSFDGGAGGISRVRGTNGSATVSNGELVVDNGDEPDLNVFLDANSPKAANGMVTYTVRPTTATPWPAIRHGVVFRYVDASNFGAVYFDNTYGSIVYHNGVSATTLVPSGVHFANGKTYKIEVAFSNQTIVVRVDGVQQFSGEVSHASAVEGRIGFFGWSTGINYIDHVSFKVEATAPPFIDFHERYGNYFNNGSTGFSRVIGSTATASVVNGELEVKSNNTNGAMNLLVDGNSPAIADGRVEMTVRTVVQSPSPGVRFGIVFRYASVNDYSLLQFDPANGAVFWKTAASNGTLLASGINFASGKSYKIEVAYEGTNIILKINGIEKFNGTVSGITTAAGKIGFESWASSDVYYDNVIYMDETTNSLTRNFTWEFGPDVDLTSPQKPYWLFADGDAGIARDAQNQLWFLHGNSEEWWVAKGTNMDDLQDQYQGVRDASFTQPNGDDLYWTCGLWIDPSNGKWYTTVHIESRYIEPTPFGGWTRRIGLATSTDEGRNWHYEGDILTGFNNDVLFENIPGYTKDAGVGDQILYTNTRDGYFYLYYHRGWGNALRVARAPISGKMAPGTWTKWYNGAWSEPGLKGHDSDVFNRANGMTVFYSTSFNKYVGIYKSTVDHSEMMTTATDLSLQNWETPVKFAEGSRVSWYNYAVDANGNRDNLGESFRFYSQPEFRKYMTVTFKGGKTTSGTQPSTYSAPEPVLDYNPGYGSPLNSSLQDFNAGSGGWTAVLGSGSWTRPSNRYVGTASTSNPTIAVDQSATSLADGFYSFLVNPGTTQKFGAVLRYVSGTNYSAIHYDNGAFTWSNGSGQNGSLFSMTPFANNSTHRIDIDYAGTSIRIKVDGWVKFDGPISGLTVSSGKAGFIVWGSASAEFDNVMQSSTVSPRQVREVTIKDAVYSWTAYSAITMANGTTKQLYPEIYPYDATNKNLIWSSTNTSIFTVNSSGLLTAVNPGTAYLAIDSQDGGVKRKIKVTVQ